jgi:hypothetical protein
MSFKDLNSLADEIIFDELLLDSSTLIVNAQDKSSFFGGVTSYLKSLYDPEKPISSIMSFMGPGLLLRAGFPWVAVIYELMSALGFDWKSLWYKLGTSIAGIVKEAKTSGATVDEISPQIDDAIETHVSNGFTGDMDADKVKDILGKGLVSENSTTLSLTSFGADIQYNLIKQASVKSKLIKWLISKLSWLVKTALISLGIVGAGAVVSGLAGGAKPLGGLVDGSGSETPSTPEQPNIPLSTKAPRELFTFNRNDLSSVWIEAGDINNISNEIMTWILSAYPQLDSKKDKIQSSSGFQDILKKFNDRNRLASGTGLLAVPRPYQRRIDIVNSIISPFTKENSSS